MITVHFLLCIAFCYRLTLVACSGNYRPNWWAMQYGRFLPRDGMLLLSAVYAVVVCLSICLCVSVTFRYCIKTYKRRITQIMPHDRSETIVFIARGYVKRGICRRRVSVCLCVCLSVCLSHSGNVSKRINVESRK